MRNVQNSFSYTLARARKIRVRKMNVEARNALPSARELFESYVDREAHDAFYVYVCELQRFPELAPAECGRLIHRHRAELPYVATKQERDCRIDLMFSMAIREYLDRFWAAVPDEYVDCMLQEMTRVFSSWHRIDGEHSSCTHARRVQVVNFVAALPFVRELIPQRGNKARTIDVLHRATMLDSRHPEAGSRWYTIVNAMQEDGSFAGHECHPRRRSAEYEPFDVPKAISLFRNDFCLQNCKSVSMILERSVASLLGMVLMLREPEEMCDVEQSMLRIVQRCISRDDWFVQWPEGLESAAPLDRVFALHLPLCDFFMSMARSLLRDVKDASRLGDAVTGLFFILDRGFWSGSLHNRDELLCRAEYVRRELLQIDALFAYVTVAQRGL